MTIGVVGYDHIIILPEDADDESVQEAVDMVLRSMYYAMGHYAGQQHFDQEQEEE